MSKKEMTLNQIFQLQGLGRETILSCLDCQDCKGNKVMCQKHTERFMQSLGDILEQE